jgi:hypothetical protein
MGSVPQLETVLIEMIVETADFPVASFDSVAGVSADLRASMRHIVDIAEPRVTGTVQPFAAWTARQRVRRR